MSLDQVLVSRMAARSSCRRMVAKKLEEIEDISGYWNALDTTDQGRYLTNFGGQHVSESEMRKQARIYLDISDTLGLDLEIRPHPEPKSVFKFDGYYPDPYAWSVWCPVFKPDVIRQFWDIRSKLKSQEETR